MYCQESPEPWFEDFGTATLTNGRAVVELDPDFDAVVSPGAAAYDGAHDALRDALVDRGFRVRPRRRSMIQVSQRASEKSQCPPTR